jgi:lactate dehydrogenase-like 2-hydroxyacid dehydrogenase
MIDAHVLALLPRGNLDQHGGLIVDSDVIDALKSGQLAAAGLDVFEREPAVNPGLHRNANPDEHDLLDNISAVLLGNPAPSLAQNQG